MTRDEIEERLAEYIRWQKVAYDEWENADGPRALQARLWYNQLSAKRANLEAELKRLRTNG